MLAPPSLALEVRVMFFELYVHDGQKPVKRPMLSGDSSCYLCLSFYIFRQHYVHNHMRNEVGMWYKG